MATSRKTNNPEILRIRKELERKLVQKDNEIKKHTDQLERIEADKKKIQDALDELPVAMDTRPPQTTGGTAGSDSDLTLGDSD